jgi:YVTN family beta-propeller protein
MFRQLISILAVVCAATSARAGVTPSAQALDPGAYHLLKAIPLPGDKGWDYCVADSEARRLYVTHSDQVLVLDLDANTLVGSVGPFQGIHGVALAPDFGRGYVSDGRAGAIGCFDLKTLKLTQSILGRADADAIIYDPASQQVFAFNGDDQSATVIDAASNSVVATLPLGGTPESAAVDGKGKLYVNLVDKDELLTLDTKARKIVRRNPLAPGQHPAALSFDPAGGALFSGCRNQKGVVLDAAKGTVKQVLAIGERVDASVFDPGLATEFQSCGDGTLWPAQRMKDGSYKALDPVQTRKGSRTLALDLKTHRLYLPAAEFEALPLSDTAQAHVRPKMLTGSFCVLVFGPDKP